MRRSFLCALVSFGVLAAVVLVAQLPAQPAKTSMALMTDFTVKPSMMAEFRNAVKAWVKFYAEHKSQYGWAAHASDDYHCLFISQVADFADIGKMFNEDETLSAKFLAEVKALNDKLTTCYESSTSYVVTFKPELSRIPERPREGQGNTFLLFDIWYVIPGMEQEFEKLEMESVALAKAKKTIDGWKCMAGGIGCDQPVYIFCNQDLEKGLAEFYAHNAEMWNSLGKEATPITAKMEKTLRKRETKYFWYDPEMSYLTNK